jgi:hypothetical protein
MFHRTGDPWRRNRRAAYPTFLWRALDDIGHLRGALLHNRSAECNSKSQALG